ncbi:MAG: heme exporter protein CcmD [Pseudomonadota bacterium]|nr:heme exporter protein CcmD [Pseudomonadota bacterium]
MHWNSLQDFFAMGGYAFFVWSSVLVTAAALALELWLLRQRRLQLPAQLHSHSPDQQASQ